jgi:hypothetical protein
MTIPLDMVPSGSFLRFGPRMKWVQVVDADKCDALKFEGDTILDYDLSDTAESLQRLRALL